MPSSCSPPQPPIPGSLFFLENTNNNNNNNLPIPSNSETLDPLQNLQQMPGRLDERCAWLPIFIFIWEKVKKRK